MELRSPRAVIFVPDGMETDSALARTTHMAVGAHQDDIEIMAYSGILACFGSRDEWFSGITVTDGAGSPRDGLYADYTDDEMQEVRAGEQRKAAVVGEYAAMAMLKYTSAQTKDPRNVDVVADIRSLIAAARPRVLYTHNLADKHDTHVAVALRTIEALRELPPDVRPEAAYGCEVWRDLDWMTDDDKVALDVAGREHLAAALVGVFDSQIAGGKRYDLATAGRRRAHATYHASHGTDETDALVFAMDLTPLILDEDLNIAQYAMSYIERFGDDVSSRLRRLGEAAWARPVPAPERRPWSRPLVETRRRPARTRGR